MESTCGKHYMDWSKYKPNDSFSKRRSSEIEEVEYKDKPKRCI